MRIGIDARTACHPKTGDRTYTLGLIRGLEAVTRGSSHEFVLYVDTAPPAALDLPDGERWRVRVLEALHPRLWTLSTLPREARRDRVDLLHVQYNGPRLRDPVLVTTVHDVTFRLHPESFSLKDRLLLDWGLRSTLSVAAEVLAVSECTALDIERTYGVERDRITVTYNALPPGFAAPEPEAVPPVLARHGIDFPYALFVGVLQPRKNVARIVRAFCSARQRADLPHRLAIAGKRGWLSAEIDAAISEAGDAIRLLGYVPDEDLPALYAGADAFLFPTLYEGFGIPVLEAFACGTPVVTSNVSALPEVAGDAALLVKPTSLEEISSAIEAALCDDALRERLRRRGLERVRRFDWRQTAELTLQAYERAVTRR